MSALMGSSGVRSPRPSCERHGDLFLGNAGGSAPEILWQAWPSLQLFCGESSSADMPPYITDDLSRTALMEVH
jgi:hypothetical protein